MDDSNSVPYEGWEPAMGTPTKKFYTSQVTDDTYKFQSKEFTAQAVTELMDQVRRDPTLANKTVHFQRSHSIFQSQEAILKFVYSALLVGGLLYVFYHTPHPTIESELHRRFSTAMCSDAAASAGGPEEFENSHEAILLSPPFALFVTVVAFLTWIGRMQLDNMHLMHVITLPLQILRTLLHIFQPHFISFVIVTVVSLAFRTILPVGECSWLVRSIVELPFVEDVLRGCTSFVEQIPLDYQVSSRVNSAIALSVFFTCLSFVVKNLIGIAKKNMTSVLTLVYLVFAVATYRMLEGVNPQPERRGMLFVLSIMVARAVDIITNAIQYWKVLPKDEVLEEEIIDEDERKTTEEPKKDL
eukprot:TRINITY_DN5456_c0_g1_i1.p1 TRINITY_DN5456_c0_g1~~TRINITY_DN5456_c0_g1_i1.p1  ORF type:complete len:357 (-),score=55.50 TRINITY_DN5456_c0_g1_i1:73-1143(-)